MWESRSVPPFINKASFAFAFEALLFWAFPIILFSFQCCSSYPSDSKLGSSKKAGDKIGISIKTCSELSVFVLWRRARKEMPLPIRLVGWQGASAGLRSYGLCDNRGEAGAAPWVWQGHLCGCLCEKGLLVKALDFWFFLSSSGDKINTNMERQASLL